jgi:hypothetical protein
MNLIRSVPGMPHKILWTAGMLTSKANIEIYDLFVYDTGTEADFYGSLRDSFNSRRSTCVLWRSREIVLEHFPGASPHAEGTYQ